MATISPRFTEIHTDGCETPSFLDSSVALKPNFLRKERLRRYRRYLYEAGAVDRAEIGQRRFNEETVVEKEQKLETIDFEGIDTPFNG